MAMRRRRSNKSSRGRRTPWRSGAWTGDVFGFPCQLAPECDITLLGGSPFYWPATNKCDSQLFFPLLNADDFGGGTATGADFQERVTYKSTELHFHMVANIGWTLSAQSLGIGSGALEIPWRCAVFVMDDDEIDFVQLPSLYSEDWLTRERVLWTSGGRFSQIGGATVDGVQTRSATIRKPTRLTTGQGVYIVWELGCVGARTADGIGYGATWDALQSGPIGVQGWHRTFYVT